MQLPDAQSRDTHHQRAASMRRSRTGYYGKVRLGANVIILAGAPLPPHPRALRVPRRGGGASSPLPSAECRRRPCCVQFVCYSQVTTTGKGGEARVPPTQGAPRPAALIVAGVQAHRAGPRPFRCACPLLVRRRSHSLRSRRLMGRSRRAPCLLILVRITPCRQGVFKYIFPLSSGPRYSEPRKPRP